MAVHILKFTEVNLITTELLTGTAVLIWNTWLSATPENFRISGLVGTNVLYLVPVLLELPQSPFFSTFGGTIRSHRHSLTSYRTCSTGSVPAVPVSRFCTEST